MMYFAPFLTPVPASGRKLTPSPAAMIALHSAGERPLRSRTQRHKAPSLGSSRRIRISASRVRTSIYCPSASAARVSTVISSSSAGIMVSRLLGSNRLLLRGGEIGQAVFKTLRPGSACACPFLFRVADLDLMVSMYRLLATVVIGYCRHGA